MDIQTIPKIVINLPSRADRLATLEKELPKLFDDCYYHLIEGVISDTPMQGIAKAHMKAVKFAKDNDWLHVLIMEDDVKFTSDKTKEYCQSAFNYAPNDFDILLGGISESDGLSMHSPWWNKTLQFCGLHFYILPAHMYDAILAYPGGYHIDRWLNMNNQYKCFVSRKMFAIQSAGFSDNVKMIKNYTDIFSKFDLLK